MPSDPAIAYDFVPATDKDKSEIMELTLAHFLSIEPHSVALGITADNGKELINMIVSKSLKCIHSRKIIHKQSGKIVGVRLMSVSERAGMCDSIDVEALDEGVRIYAGIVDKLKATFWNLKPEAEKVLRREITFVHRDHQRRGIAQHLLHLGLDFDRLRASGFDGIVSEASSIANQTLLSKAGYEELAMSKTEEYIRSNGTAVTFPDATTAVKLMYLSLA